MSSTASTTPESSEGDVCKQQEDALLLRDQRHFVEHYATPPPGYGEDEPPATKVGSNSAAVTMP